MVGGVVSQGRFGGRLEALSRPSHSREFRASETDGRNPRGLGVADGSHRTSSFQCFVPPESSLLLLIPEKSEGLRVREMSECHRGDNKRLLQKNISEMIELLERDREHFTSRARISRANLPKIRSCTFVLVQRHRNFFSRVIKNS